MNGHTRQHEPGVDDLPGRKGITGNLLKPADEDKALKASPLSSGLSQSFGYVVIASPGGGGGSRRNGE